MQSSSSPGPGQYGSADSKQHVGISPNPPRYTFGLKTLGDKESGRKPGPAGELNLMFCACLLIQHITLQCPVSFAQQHQSLSASCYPLVMGFVCLCTFGNAHVGKII